MQCTSRQVSSAQSDIHARLAEQVERHRRHVWQRPVPEHGRRAFACAERWLAGRGGPLQLDAGCGTGLSSLQLARQCPDAQVIGVDKSRARLGRGLDRPLPDNLLLLRADLVDLWRLAAAAGWRLARHCVFYPNPWPKPGHFGRRWHGHPVFPDLLVLGGELELRTNWEIYAREWSAALELHGWTPDVDTIGSADAVSPFERKYLASGHRCWRVRATG